MLRDIRIQPVFSFFLIGFLIVGNQAVLAQESPAPVVENRPSVLTKPLELPAPITRETAEELFKPLMEVPQSLDAALGSLSLNDGSCDFKFAYSSEIIDLIGGKPPRYEILLVSRPVPARNFSEVDSLLGLTGADQCWFFAEIESKLSLNPIKIFMPGKEPVSYTDSTQPFLRRKIEAHNSVIAGTIYFKDPLTVGSAVVKGQVSFRSSFRKLGLTHQMVLKKSQLIQGGAQGIGDQAELATTDTQKKAGEAYLSLLSDLGQDQARGIASVPPAAPSSGPVQASLLPAKVVLKQVFFNPKRSTLILEGTYSEEQMKLGLTLFESKKRDSTQATIYGIALMSQREGRWNKDQIHWLETLPEWALGNQTKSISEKK